MKQRTYLLDTHALLMWHSQDGMTAQFIAFLDYEAREGRVFVSAISFWELTLLVQKKRIAISEVHKWKNELMTNTNINLLNVSAEEMIDSTLLTDHHKDPFDRLLISQATRHDLILVTQDNLITQYKIACLWDKHDTKG